MKSTKNFKLILTVLTIVLLFSATFTFVSNFELNSNLEKHEDSDLNYKQDNFLDKLLTSQAEDVYEENDIRTSAYDLSFDENIWLSNIGGFGVQEDDDWFEIYINSGFQRLVVHLLFYDAEGDIDISVHNSIGTYVTGSISMTDNEFIDYILPSSGTYYLRIHYGNAGNTYDLLWDDIGTAATDDFYEENDIRTSAYDISTNEREWLSSINGLGISSDADWYKISNTFDALRFVVFCYFSDTAGDIGIALYDSSGILLTYSNSLTDHEGLDFVVSTAGDYYILVYYAYGGNTYDLWWDDLPTGDDRYEENDIRTSAYDLSLLENTWLSSMTYGLAIQSDYDWYEIFISPGEEHLAVTLSFSDAAGNIDIAVYDSVGAFITSSTSTTNDEYIDLLLASSGTYYLRVFGANAGNLYELWWDDLPPPSDDAYEENDNYLTAYYHVFNEMNWLTEVDGAGIQADDDWYQIDITPGFEHLIVDLVFTDAAGNINIRVYASDGTTIITRSTSITDNEYIDTILPSSGTYYLRVYGDNAGNLYDLWWDDLIRPLDDNYEENDDYFNAYDHVFNEMDWLTEVDGAGIQADNDWYEIDITPGFENLVVDLRFTHAQGNIDLAVYASDGTTVITGSGSVTDNEYIDTLLPSSGTYYLRVFGANAGNLYDLWWDDILPPVIDDNYEENDAHTTAYDLTTLENTWLNTIDGYGIQSDYDWYEIFVNTGAENVLVDLQFTHASGNIDLGLINSSLSLVAASTSSTDDEYIDVVVPSGGTYYIYIEGDNAGNTYDLWWDDIAPITGDDAYEENDLPATAYDLTADDGTWLNTIAGMGIQSDWDWYEIDVPSGYERVIIDCTFTHAAGDINIQLWNTTDGIWGSISTTDDEYIDYIVVSSGTHYILVYGDDAGNSYNLWWDAQSLIVDDAYEENDVYTSAYDLTSHPDTWLTAISGPGIQSDFDFYKVSITSPNQRIIIDVTYTYSEGALVLMLADSVLTPLATSNTSANNEHIDQALTATGTYYILVAGLGLGNSYDLKYKIESITTEKPIPGYDLIFLITVLSAVSVILIRKRIKKLAKIGVNS